MNPAPPSQDTPEIITCHVCGCESPLVIYFRKTRKGRLCPRCLPGESSSALLKSYGLLLVFGFFLSVLVSRGANEFRLAPLLNMVLFVVLTWFMICIHEAIHGLTAWALGGRVFEIALGGGRIWHCVWWRGTRFSLRHGLFMGLCVGAFPERRYIRLRWLLLVIAPIVAQIALVVLLLSDFDAERYVTQMAVFEMLVWVNVVVIAANLFPRKFTATLATDGYWLWEIIRGRKAAEELHALYFVAACVYAYEYEDFPAMLAASEAGFALYPENEQIRNCLAAASLAQERYAEGLVYLEQFLAEESASAPSDNRALFVCNRSVALFHLALEPEGINPEQLAQAHASASEAFSLIPWVAPAELVRAISVHFQGDHQAAIDLLEKAIAHLEKDSDRAEGLAFVALAQHALGQSDMARASLAQARRLYPKGGRTLQRVGEVVGADVI